MATKYRMPAVLMYQHALQEDEEILHGLIRDDDDDYKSFSLMGGGDVR
jgi:hypothetical protein